MKHILSATAVLLLLCAYSSFAQLSIVDNSFSDSTKADRTLSFSYANKDSSLILARGENENLAKLKKAYIVYTGVAPIIPLYGDGNRVVDGADGTYIVFDPKSYKDNTGSYIMIDLLSVRLVNRLVVKQAFSQKNLNTRVRAYTLEVGTDSLTMTRVIQQPNSVVAATDTTFDVVAARFLKFTITAMANEAYQAIIGEVEVYGTGYLSEAVYVSTPRIAIGPANWGAVSWNAVLPNAQTALTFQFRTGDTPAVDSAWCDWSDPVTHSGSVFGVFEPRKYMQYKVNLSTSGLQTPQLNSITLNYDTTMVAAKAVAKIESRVEPVLQKVNVAYNVALDFAKNNYGVDTLRLVTPTPILVKSVLRDGREVSPRILYDLGHATLIFPDTISTKTDLQINFSATIYLDQMSFPCEISSSKSPSFNPQRVERSIIDGTESWTIRTIGISNKLLVDTKIEPNPFTPNGDGKNDQTSMSFYIANVAVPRALTLSIYDVTGRKIRNLFRQDVLANAFVGLNAIVWDGRNDDGKIVRPGLYIVKIQLDADSNGGETVCKTVTVVY